MMRTEEEERRDREYEAEYWKNYKPQGGKCGMIMVVSLIVLLVLTGLMLP